MHVCMYLCMHACIDVCMYFCLYVCTLYVCMYTSWIPYAACSCTNSMCMYHGQVSHRRHMCVSRTALTDLTFIDCTQTNGASTRAHLMQNKVKNWVMNGWLAIFMAVMPVVVMQLAVIILAVMQ